MSPSPRDRVTVTSPRAASRRTEPVSPRHEVDEQTEVGMVYLRSLMRVQLRLSLFFLGGLLAVTAGVPLACRLDPGISDLTVAGIPLPWLLLGVLAYPALWLVGRAYVRMAERAEREFTDLVDEE